MPESERLFVAVAAVAGGAPGRQAGDAAEELSASAIRAAWIVSATFVRQISSRMAMRAARSGTGC